MRVCGVVRAALLVLAVLGSAGCTCSVAQPMTRQLRHRYVTVEIGDATCDVTKYGAIGDGKTDVCVCPRQSLSVYVLSC